MTEAAQSEAPRPEAPRPKLLEAFGVELECMILDQRTLDVAPICDRVLEAESEVERGGLAWSNELVLHVLEFKTNGPAPLLGGAGFDGLAASFQADIAEAARRLAAHGAVLCGSAMHPWMDPAREAKLWPHEFGAVYRAYDRLFDCRGHGWSNLQSTHLNLSFDGDEDFERLHTAIRALLPLLPAAAASSPFQDGRMGPWSDTRLFHYERNQRRFPVITGLVVPEPVASEQEYRERILDPIAREVVAPNDPDGVLSPHFMNSRGAIARFDRGSIEVRVLDIQEHPAADIALLELVVAVLRRLGDLPARDRARLRAIPTERLAEAYQSCAQHGEEAQVFEPELLELLGWRGASPARAGDVWKRLAAEHRLSPPSIVRGTLSARMAARRGRGESLRSILEALAQCLAEGRDFEA